MPDVGYEIAAPDVIAEALDGEVLIVNLATGVYFRGDEGVAQAWAAVTSGVAHSRSKLSVNPALISFIDELLTEGLIRECSTAELSTRETLDLPSGPFALERFEDLQDMLALDPIHDVDPNAGWPQPR